MVFYDGFHSARLQSADERSRRCPLPVPPYESLARKAKRYPDLDPVATTAYLTLCEVGDHLRDVRDRTLALSGISHGRLMILAILDRCPDQPQSATALAEQAGVTKQTVTALLDGLAGDGLVCRGPHPNDRRSVLVALTAAGRELLERVLPGLYRRQVAAMADLTGDEQSQLVRLLGKIGLSAEPPPRPSAGG